MPAYNKVILIGHLGRDPELRATPSGAFVAKFSMAVTRTWKNKAGEKQEEVCWAKIVAWNKDAETLAKNVKKGDPLLVEGRLSTRSWSTDQGEKREMTEVVVERFQFIGGKKPARSAAPEADDQNVIPDLEDDDDEPTY